MSSPDQVRRSSIMGTWYSADSKSLRWLMDGFMDNVPDQPLQGELRALIAPHAGYQFSGQTAAHSYKQVVGKKFDAIIVIGPSHRVWLGNFAISAEEAYETPFGRAPLAADLIAELHKRLPVMRVREHQEHSIEMQLPLLQYALGTAALPLVPILMSADELAPCVQLGQAIAELMRTRNLLLVASSDLNHLNSYGEVKRRDADVISAVECFELNAMAEVLLNPAYTVCGRAPILTVSAAAQALGANSVQVLSYTNSGEVTGRKGEGMYTVGYLSAAIIK